MVDNNLLERKLKAKCAERGLTLEQMCKKLKINYPKLRRKLNGDGFKWDFDYLFAVTQWIDEDINNVLKRRL